MSRRTIRTGLLTVVGCALMLVSLACASDGEDEPAMLSGPITMTVSGGIAPLSETVEVTADGAVTRTRGRTRQTATMATDELDRLAALAESPGLFETDRDHRGQGADMRTYTLQYRDITIVTDDRTMPPEVAEIVELLEAATGA